jgi:hypothetical protein
MDHRGFANNLVVLEARDRPVRPSHRASAAGSSSNLPIRWQNDTRPFQNDSRGFLNDTGPFSGATRLNRCVDRAETSAHAPFQGR